MRGEQECGIAGVVAGIVADFLPGILPEWLPGEYSCGFSCGLLWRRPAILFGEEGCVTDMGGMVKDVTGSMVMGMVGCMMAIPFKRCACAAHAVRLDEKRVWSMPRARRVHSLL